MNLSGNKGTVIMWNPFKKKKKKTKEDRRNMSIIDSLIKRSESFKEKDLVEIVDAIDFLNRNFLKLSERIRDNRDYSDRLVSIFDEQIDRLDSEIEALGKKFDPYSHEALMQEKSDKEDIVLEELQTGYKFKDKVIRHTKVKVSKR